MSAAWKLEGTIAQLAVGPCVATVDLARPDQGLAVQLRGDAAGASGLQILGVAFGDRLPVAASGLDAYVRGADLVASYDETPPRMVRACVYWRCIDPAEFCPTEAAQVAAAFDLILSVNTSLLDNDPQASVCTTILPATEVLNLRNADSGDSSPTGGWLARQPGAAFSYVEIVHPADFYQSTASAGDGAPPRIAITHRLFPQRLEKGVILRARVRAALVARQNDEATAMAAYQRFANAEPPLTV